MHLKWETNQMNFKCISREKEKKEKELWEFYCIDDKKRPRICWMWNQQLPNY